MARRAAALLAIWSCCLVAADARARVPDWVREALQRPGGNLAKGADSIVLEDDGLLDVARNGRMTVQARFALRVLRPAGRDRAVARVYYFSRGARVKSFNAWLIDPTGAVVRTYGKRDVLDLATSADNLYSEARVALIDASEEVDAGWVFAAESEKQERMDIGQGTWNFQGFSPVLRSRQTIHVPDGWRVEGRLQRHAPVAPSVNGTTYTWELAQLPAVEDEPFAPPLERLVARLLYDLEPPADARRSPLRTFSSWNELAEFAARLHSIPSNPAPAVAARARELCAGATTAWDRIRALATYTQSLRYVSIEMNLSRGGGYTPHEPAEVLRCGYGDCKDKTHLLRALLAAVDVTAYPVLCYSGDRDAVTPDWPSPLAFNHVFAAIAVDDSVHSPFVLEHPRLGRLLLFDPTDRDSPLGDFPRYNQGALVLICAPGETELTRVPRAPLERDRVSRHLTAVLQPSGAIEANLTATYRGAAAAWRRREIEQPVTARKELQDWLRQSAPGARVTREQLQAGEDADTATIEAAFTAPGYARTIRDRLLVFAPAIVDRLASVPFNARTRALPIVLEPEMVEETTEFSFPAGFRVSETGAAVNTERSFGRYTATITEEDGRIVFHRSLEIRAVELPAENYEEVRTFYEDIRRAENTPVVLERAD